MTDLIAWVSENLDFPFHVPTWKGTHRRFRGIPGLSTIQAAYVHATGSFDASVAFRNSDLPEARLYAFENLFHYTPPAPGRADLYWKYGRHRYQRLRVEPIWLLEPQGGAFIWLPKDSWTPRPHPKPRQASIHRRQVHFLRLSGMKPGQIWLVPYLSLRILYGEREPPLALLKDHATVNKVRKAQLRFPISQPHRTVDGFALTSITRGPLDQYADSLFPSPARIQADNEHAAWIADNSF